jgi:phenylpropionate dioxygenase-like ring-hydroxylating dioxygenase large terminal subunit
VVEGSGRTRLFTCPFHAWAYALDGTLVAAPFMEGAEGFDPGACRLPEARTEILEETGLIFVNLSKTGAAGVDPPKAFFEAGLCEAVAAGPHQDLAVALDWKTVMDEQPTDGAPVHVLAPNVRLHLDGGAARLELVYPNGPGAAMVRSLGLLGVTGEAVSLDEPSERIALYVDRRRQACG